MTCEIGQNIPEQKYYLCMQKCRTSRNEHILCRQSIMYIPEIFRYSPRACLPCNGLTSTQPGKDIAVLPVPKHHVMKVKKYSTKNTDDQSQWLISYFRNILTGHTGWTHNPFPTRWQWENLWLCWKRSHSLPVKVVNSLSYPTTISKTTFLELPSYQCWSQ